MSETGFIQKQEYADLIPKLTTRDYERLKRSINQYGLQYPLILNQERVVLDGHHRLQVCNELGIQPAYITKDFSGNPLEELKFVIMVNINRRQLNEFERAQIAIKFKKLYAEKTGGLSGKDRMKATQFTKITGKQAAVKRWYGDTENLIEETQSVFGSS